jgi:hypothetical protein
MMPALCGGIADGSKHVHIKRLRLTKQMLVKTTARVGLAQLSAPNLA